MMHGQTQIKFINKIWEAVNINIMDFWVVRSELVSTACRIIIKFDKELFTKVFENERISWKSARECHILLRE
jgi:hypothetical protein